MYLLDSTFSKLIPLIGAFVVVVGLIAAEIVKKLMNMICIGAFNYQSNMNISNN